MSNEIKEGDIVIDKSSGLRLLVLGVSKAGWWIYVVPATKSGKRDKRYIGWSGRFDNVEKLAEGGENQ